MRIFAERLKELRLEKHLSHAELAKELGFIVTKSAIGHWENGIRTPSLEAAAAVAKYFGVSLDYLAGLED